MSYGLGFYVFAYIVGIAGFSPEKGPQVINSNSKP